MSFDRRELLWALMAAPWVLTACGSLPAAPRQVDISEKKLLALVSKPFPLQKRYLELFDLTLSEPALRLMPEQNRIGTRLNFSASTLLNRTQPWTGHLEMSYGLRYEARDLTVRLDAVRLEGLQLDGVPQPYAQGLRGAGTYLAEELLQNLVVHQFKPEDLRRVDGMGYQPGMLMVVPGGLRLQLDPKTP